MDFNMFKEAVIAAAAAAGLTDYELYYESSESTKIDAFQHGVNEFSSGVSGGVCFRCVVNGKMGYASTEALDPARAAELVSRAVENAGALESDDPVFLCPGGQTYEKVERKSGPQPSTEELIAVLLDTQEKLYAADGRVVDGCSAQVIRSAEKVAIVNSRGLDISSENSTCGVIVSAVVSDGAEMTDDFGLKLGRLEEIDTDKLTRKAVDNALAKLGGGVPPTGACPVVFSAGAMASMLGTFSAIFSSESTQKGLSKLGGREGETIASPAVTLVDDPFYPDNPEPMPFDAEGSPTRKKNVIENGVLRTLLYNLKTAAVAGKETTGNAAKRGYAAPVGIRPFTMYLAPGQLTEEELLAKAGTGVFINALGGLHAGANPVTGDFSLQSAGFLIEGGKKTAPVKSFTVAGNFYDLLGQITALSDTVELPMAMGKTAFGSPCVLVEGLSVAGK